MLFQVEVTNVKTSEHRPLWIESPCKEEAQYAALVHAFHEWEWSSSSAPTPVEVRA